MESIKLRIILIALLSVTSYVNCQNCDQAANKYLQCSSDPKDCSTIWLCDPKKSEPPLSTITCQSEAPYCNKKDTGDMCGTAPDPSKQSCSPNKAMKCVQSGLFPDLDDCSIFYSCYETIIGSDAPASSCYPGSIFHLGQQKCVAGTTCTKLTCTKNGFFPHPINPEYYCACVKDAAGKFSVTQILKCKKGEKYSITLGCQYTCIKQGYFPHEEKKKFYSCTLISGAWVSQVLTCEGELEFRPDLNSCGPKPGTTNLSIKSIMHK